MSTPPSPHARSCTLIQLHFVLSWFGDSAFHCLLMLPPAVVVPILTLSAITGPPAHALGSSAGEAFLWERAAARVCREAGATVAANVLLRDLNIITRQHDDRRIEVIANGLPLWGGVQLAVDTTLVSALDARGRLRRHQRSTVGAALRIARSNKERTYPSSCVLRSAASLCSPSRSQDAGAQRLSSSSVFCPAAEPGPRRPTCGPAALQRGCSGGPDYSPSQPPGPSQPRCCRCPFMAPPTSMAPSPT